MSKEQLTLALQQQLLGHPWLHFELVAILLVLIGMATGFPLGIVFNMWADRISERFVDWLLRKMGIASGSGGER